MSLEKVTYVNGETVIYADNLNDIQDEIIENRSRISTFESAVSELEGDIEDLGPDTTLSVSGSAAEAAAAGFLVRGIAGALEQTPYNPTNKLSVTPRAGINISTGNNVNGSHLARTGYTGMESSIVIVSTYADFKYHVWGYRLQSDGSRVRSLTNQQRVLPGTPVVIPHSEGIRYFRVGFSRISGDAETTDAEAAAIQAGLRIYSILPVHGENYSLVQFLPGPSTSGASDVTGQVSSMTVIRDKLFVWPYLSGSTGTTTGKVYGIGEDGLLTYESSFESNIGHANTVDYNPKNYCMLATRYPEASETGTPVYNLYVFQNVKDTTASFDVDDTTMTSGKQAVVTIDMTGYLPSSYGVCENINAVWGPDNFGRNDLVCVLARFNQGGTKRRIISIVQLGMGSNNLGGGTLISGCVDDAFNGTYKVQKTLEREYRSDENTNDACFHNGKIYELITTVPNGVRFMIHSFENYMDEIRTERVYIPRYSKGGSAGLNYEPEGITIYKGHLYTGAHSDGIRVFAYRD